MLLLLSSWHVINHTYLKYKLWVWAQVLPWKQHYGEISLSTTPLPNVSCATLQSIPSLDLDSQWPLGWLITEFAFSGTSSHWLTVHSSTICSLCLPQCSVKIIYQFRSGVSTMRLPYSILLDGYVSPWGHYPADGHLSCSLFLSTSDETAVSIRVSVFVETSSSFLCANTLVWSDGVRDIGFRNCPVLSQSGCTIPYSHQHTPTAEQNTMGYLKYWQSIVTFVMCTLGYVLN